MNERPRELELDSELAAFLLKHDFDASQLDMQREYGLTALMRAAWQGQTQWVDVLLARGADPHVTNMDGNNALWLACVSNELACVKRLLRAGLDIDHRNAVGATALMYAASAAKPSWWRSCLPQARIPTYAIRMAPKPSTWLRTSRPWRYCGPARISKLSG